MRRKWTAMTIRELMERRKNSRCSIGDFCKNENMTPSMFYLLRRKEKKYFQTKTEGDRENPQVIELLGGKGKDNSIELSFPTGFRLRFDSTLSCERLDGYIRSIINFK